MVKVTLKGNYNIDISDLKLSFSPDQKEKMISEEDFENSSDLKYFLPKYFKIERENEAKKEVVRTVVEPEKQVEIHEIPVKEEVHEVIDATDKSLSESLIKAKEEFEKKLDEQVIDATNASKEQVEVKEEVKQEEVVIAEPKEEETAKAVEDKPLTPKKKSGRPKKNK